jgi:flagellar biosynthesis/type III secretory pathway protein FliH
MGLVLLFAGVVVTSELPRERDTLLLRRMGAGACLREAVAELAALPVEARERAIAGPVLLRCHIEIPKDPANRTNEDEEFMSDTQDIFEEWQRENIAKGLAEGRAKGAAEGLAQGLGVIYEIRFGTMPPALKTVIEATEEAATLLAWIRLAETSSAETFAATVLASRAG